MREERTLRANRDCLGVGVPVSVLDAGVLVSVAGACCVSVTVVLPRPRCGGASELAGAAELLAAVVAGASLGVLVCDEPEVSSIPAKTSPAMTMTARAPAPRRAGALRYHGVRGGSGGGGSPRRAYAAARVLGHPRHASSGVWQFNRYLP